MNVERCIGFLGGAAFILLLHLSLGPPRPPPPFEVRVEVRHVDDRCSSARSASDSASVRAEGWVVGAGSEPDD